MNEQAIITTYEMQFKRRADHLRLIGVSIAKSEGIKDEDGQGTDLLVLNLSTVR